MKRVFNFCAVVLVMCLLVAYFKDSICKVVPLDSFKDSIVRGVPWDSFKESFGKIFSMAHRVFTVEVADITATPAQTAPSPQVTSSLTPIPVLVLTKVPLTGKTETFTTLEGEPYTGVIKRVEPDGIVLRTSDGVPKLKFRNLLPEVGVKYGYDPELEAQFLKLRNREDFVEQQNADKIYQPPVQRPSKAALPSSTVRPVAVNTPLVSPPVEANNLVQNGDFSEGKIGWYGDGQPLADYLRYHPQDASTNLPAKGLVIELNSRNWTKLSQRINGDKNSRYILKMKYLLSPGITLSTLPADYTDIIGHTQISEWQGFNPINLSPGQFFDTIKDSSDEKGFYEQYRPNLSSTEEQIYEHNVPLIPPAGRKIVAVAFPPGKGFVLIESISVTSH